MSDAPTSGEIVGGKYRILRALGQGGMGIVFEAQNVVTGKRVALKWLRPQLGNDRDASERFMREARVASRVHHQNVVDLYDVGRHDDALFLVMEYLDGESLAAFLARGLRPIPETVSLLLGAMRGLAAAHKQGIVHRDLKPENIFLARESDDAVITPKVLDFGISKLIAPETGQLELTRAGCTFGTPMYTSFEQLMAYRDIDARADVYSFGVILYEALTGKLPYPAQSFQQLVALFASTKPVSPRTLRTDLPAALTATILKTLSLDRAERPQSIEALIAAVQPFALAAPRVAPSELSAERTHSRSRAYTERLVAVPVSPRREHAAAEVSPKSAARARRRESGARYSWWLFGCALLAVVLWFLKPTDGPAAHAAPYAPAVSSAKAAPSIRPLPKGELASAADHLARALGPVPSTRPLSAAEEAGWSGVETGAPVQPPQQRPLVRGVQPPPRAAAQPRAIASPARTAHDAGAYRELPAMPSTIGLRRRVPLPRADQF